MSKDLGGDLPLPTRIAVGLSNMLTSPFGILIYAAMGVGVFLFLRWIKTEPGRKFWGHASLKIPAKIGDTIQKSRSPASPVLWAP
jgi:type IV pilus assembly protein PilC